MAKLFDNGIFSVIDATGAALAGAKLYWYVAGTSTPQDTYTDPDLDPVSHKNTNPVVADADGRFGPIYLANADYKYVLTDADEVTLVTRDDFSGGLDGVSSFMTTLLDDTSAEDARTTLGIGTENLGALGAGSTTDTVIDKSFSGHSGGTTDYRNVTIKTTSSGANDIAQQNCLNIQAEMRLTGGTETFLYGIQGYNRTGLSGSTTGDVTTSRGIEWHTANEGSGTITNAYDFYAQDVDLLDGTGTIGTVIGFLCGNQGDATRVTTAAIGFDCADMTGGAPLTAAVRSQMASGTGKYFLYGAASAPSVHLGKMAVGSVTSPTDQFEVKSGYLKASGDTTFLFSGTSHELRSANNDFAATISNKHASGPHGLDIYFSGAAPNNTTQIFLRARDSSSTKIIAYSNGTFQNATGTYTTISDEREKEEIEAVDYASLISNFRKRQHKTYRLTWERVERGEDAPRRLGVIAQDEIEHHPHLVIPYVTENGEERYSFDYANSATEDGAVLRGVLDIVDHLSLAVTKLAERISVLERTR